MLRAFLIVCGVPPRHLPQMTTHVCGVDERPWEANPIQNFHGLLIEPGGSKNLKRSRGTWCPWSELVVLKFYLCRLNTRTCVKLAISLTIYLMNRHVRSKHTIKAPSTSLVEIVVLQGLRGQSLAGSHEVTRVPSPPDETSPWPPSHVAWMSWFGNGDHGLKSSRPVTLGAQSHIAGAQWSTPTGSWVRRTAGGRGRDAEAHGKATVLSPGPPPALPHALSAP